MNKIEVYEYLVLWNPNGHAGYEPPTHPNPNGVRILKTVRNIGRSLKWFCLAFPKGDDTITIKAVAENIGKPEIISNMIGKYW